MMTMTTTKTRLLGGRVRGIVAKRGFGSYVNDPDRGGSRAWGEGVLHALAPADTVASNSDEIADIAAFRYELLGASAVDEPSLAQTCECLSKIHLAGGREPIETPMAFVSLVVYAWTSLTADTWTTSCCSTPWPSG